MSIGQFLERVARRGSWLGGGSVAALSAALSAALLEKLAVQSKAAARRIQRLRRECVELIDRDAEGFSRVIQASRSGNRQAFRRALKRATEIPCKVAECAQAIQVTCRTAQRSIKPQFQSDLRCAATVALAAERAARILIQTNLAWLSDPAYARQIRRRLHTARPHARASLRSLPHG